MLGIENKTKSAYKFWQQKPRHVHDRVFRNIFSIKEVARDFFMNYLPQEVLDEIDMSTLTISKDNYLDSKCNEYISDLVYRVNMRSFANRNMYLLLEHQSSPDYNMLLRILKYSLCILEEYVVNEKNRTKKFLKLPIIYPLVVYHGRQRPYPYVNNLSDMFIMPKFAEKYMLFKFQLVDLTIIEDREICRHGKVALIEIVQKYIFTKDISLFLVSIQKNLQQLFSDIGFDKFKDIWSQVVNYIFWSRKESDGKAIMKMLQELNLKGVDMRTIAEALLDKGWEQGIEQGIEQGRQEGHRECMKTIVTKMLQQGMTIEVISKFTGLRQEIILDMQDRSL